MSGPKGIEYTIAQERRRVEEETQRFRRLLGRAQGVVLHCDTAEVSGVRIELPTAATANASSASIAAMNASLEDQIVKAQTALDDVLRNRRAREVEHDLSAALEALNRREARSEPGLRGTDYDRVGDHKGVADRNRGVASGSESLRSRVNRLLSSLDEQPSAELTGYAAAVLSAVPARARMLLDDLSAQVRAANELSTQVKADRLQAAELRSEATSVIAPAGMLAIVDAAERVLATGRSAGSLLDRARQELDHQLSIERAERDRRYVLDSVTESLEELGYVVAPVELETAETVVLRRRGADDHAVRARVVDGEIDVRTVRTAGRPSREADKAADDALCADLDTILTKLRVRGVQPGRVRRVPAGVVPPENVVVKERDKTATASTSKRRKTTERSSS